MIVQLTKHLSGKKKQQNNFKSGLTLQKTVLDVVICEFYVI